MSRGATARLFVAVDPPAEVCGRLADWAREATAGLAHTPPAAGMAHAPPAAGVRLLDPSVLHLTVCFLGARPVAEVPALASVLEGCAGHACELSLGAPLWLPPRRPRALAVAVSDPAGELLRLREQLEGALSQVSGWEPERGRLRPHVTVARIRTGGRRARGGERAVSVLEPTPRLSFMPQSLSLYRSRLEPAGASYEVLAACTLLPAED